MARTTEGTCVGESASFAASFCTQDKPSAATDAVDVSHAMRKGRKISWWGMDARGKEVGDARGGAGGERDVRGGRGGVEGTARTSSPATRAPVASSGASERTLMIARSTASLSSGCADAELEPNKPPIIPSPRRASAPSARRSDSSAREKALILARVASRRPPGESPRAENRARGPPPRSRRAGRATPARARATTATPRVPTNRAAGRFVTKTRISSERTTALLVFSQG